MQIAPSIQLMPVVRHYLVLETAQQGLFHHRLLPDGNTGMVFYYNDSAAAWANSPLAVTQRSFYYGPVKQFRDISLNGKLHMLVVVLQPAGIYALTGIAAHEFSDHITGLADVWGSESQLLEEQVYHAPNTTERIRLIEMFLIRRLQKVVPLHKQVAATVQLLQQSHGMLPVHELAKQACIGERQLERLFHRHIGLSPKQFAAIVKLQRTLKLLQHKSRSEQLTGITYDAGYYDQAHFIREFKKQAGMLPKQYLSGTTRLALNFIRFTADDHQL